jgi:hypothetical protein
MFPGELSERLARQGTSLENLRKEFRFKLLSDEYRRSLRKSLAVGAADLQDYYQRHERDFRFSEQVRWQLFEIRFNEHGGRSRAQAEVEKATAALKRGEDFSKVVRKYADGPDADEIDPRLSQAFYSTASQISSTSTAISVCREPKAVFADNGVVVPAARSGVFTLGTATVSSIQVQSPSNSRVTHTRHLTDDAGNQPWTTPGNLVDSNLSAALTLLAPGQTSAVLESPGAFRIVRLIERRPAGKKPFDEVSGLIRQKVADQRERQSLEELYRRASIESPYYPDNGAHAHPSTAVENGDRFIPLGFPIGRPEKPDHRNAT